MPLLYRLLILYSFLFLSACAGRSDLTERKSEKIIALAVDDGQLYVMGNTHDYTFPRKYTLQFERFVQSPYAEKITYIEAFGRVNKNKAVSGSITFFISPNYLSEEQQKELVERYGFVYLKGVSKSSELWKKTDLIPELTKTPDILVRDYPLEGGNIVTIKNNHDFVNKNHLSKPILITVDYIKSNTDYFISDTVTSLAMPVLTVGMIPVLIIWGLPCNDDYCKDK